MPRPTKGEMEDKRNERRSGPAKGRRHFLALASAGLALPFLTRLSAFASPEPLPPDRELAFYNTHTGESAAVAYCRSGCTSARLAREDQPHPERPSDRGDQGHRRPPARPPEHRLSRKISTDVPFHVISGYRSPKTNAFLRAHGGGVAENSLHLLGPGHRYPPPRPQTEGSLQGGGRSPGRRGRDLSGLGFRPRRRRARPDLVTGLL